ncbi:MAG: diguanylate cyclase [Deltaproteobacteria bacterium]|nr:diguanylate cyclase [Deltaproteobacteria bacterium]
MQEEEKSNGADKASDALREISIIAEIGIITGSTLDIDEVYERFCTEVGKLLSFDRLAINIHDTKKGLVTVAYAHGVPIPGRDKGNVFSLAGSVSGYVAGQKNALSGVPDPARFSDCVAAQKEGMKSFMAVPLISRDEVIASLHFRSATPDVYEKDELTVAQRIGAQITGAIANSLLYAELKKTEERLEKSEELYRTFVRNASDIILKTDAGGMFTFINPAGVQLLGYEEGEIIGINYLTLVRPDRREEAARFLGRQFVKKIENTYLEIPIVAKDGSEVWLGQNVQLLFDEEGRVTGFQAVSRNVTDRRWAEEKLKESEERYRELSILDGLTGLYNARHFHRIIEEERSRVNRYDQLLTLLFIDIDDFKKFNDTYGHLAGDDVLVRFGQIVKSSLRETDAAFRYGGEEFVILLPMTRKMDGVHLAERIKAEVAGEKFFPLSETEVHVTISVGVAQLHKEEKTETLIKRADGRMYKAKQTGKNRIVFNS